MAPTPTLNAYAEYHVQAVQATLCCHADTSGTPLSLQPSHTLETAGQRVFIGGSGHNGHLCTTEQRREFH